MLIIGAGADVVYASLIISSRSSAVARNTNVQLNRVTAKCLRPVGRQPVIAPSIEFVPKSMRSERKGGTKRLITVPGKCSRNTIRPGLMTPRTLALRGDIHLKGQGRTLPPFANGRVQTRHRLRECYRDGDPEDDCRQQHNRT